MEARDGFGKMTMFRKRSAMWSMDKRTRWKFTSQKRCSEPLPYGHGSERLWISTFMSHSRGSTASGRRSHLFCGGDSLAAPRRSELASPRIFPEHLVIHPALQALHLGLAE